MVLRWQLLRMLIQMLVELVSPTPTQNKESCNPNRFFTILFFQTHPDKASFHIPLHRYFSIFLRQAIKYQGFTLKELLPGVRLIKIISLIHWCFRINKLMTSDLFLGANKLKCLVLPCILGLISLRVCLWYKVNKLVFGPGMYLRVNKQVFGDNMYFMGKRYWSVCPFYVF